MSMKYFHYFINIKNENLDFRFEHGEGLQRLNVKKIGYILHRKTYFQTLSVQIDECGLSAIR